MAKKGSAAPKAPKPASAKSSPDAPGSEGASRRGPVLLAVVVAVAAVLVASMIGRAGGPSAQRADAGRSTVQTTDDWSVPSAGTQDSLASAAEASGIDMNLKETELPGAEAEPRVVSQSPRIYLFENLLSPAECEFLIRLVSGRLRPAGVVTQTEDKHTVQAQSRNNEQIWITPQEESTIPLLKHVLKRIHRVAYLPDTDAEALQIGRYTSGQKYESHVDTDPSHDVERPATLLIYLSDVEAGGDTLFPLSRREECQNRWHNKDDGTRTFGCARCCDSDVPGTIRVRPKRGNAILFFNHQLDGRIDPLSEHAACPVRAGEKWIAQRWFRLKPYQNIRFPPDPRFDGLPASHVRGPWDGRSRELSRKAPRAFLLENLLSDDECELLIGLAERSGKPEMSAGVERWWVGEEAEHGMPLLATIMKRLHRAARVPEAHGESLQLARYVGDMPMPIHHDADHERGRVATILVYLSDVGGGETVFPKGKCATIEDCCKSKKVLQVPPRKGRALLFFSHSAGGRTLDKAAAHGVCPVRTGTKWIAQLWFRASPTRTSERAADPVYDLPALSMTVLD